MAEKSKNPSTGHRGGARPGAGRKKGPGREKSLRLTLREKALADGISPLEVMTSAMRHFWFDAHFDGDKKRAVPDAAKLKEAAAYAQMAAPFIHPRLASHEVGGKGGGGIPLDVRGTVNVILPDNGRRNG